MTLKVDGIYPVLVGDPEAKAVFNALGKAGVRKVHASLRIEEEGPFLDNWIAIVQTPGKKRCRLVTTLKASAGTGRRSSRLRDTMTGLLDRLAETIRRALAEDLNVPPSADEPSRPEDYLQITANICVNVEARQINFWAMQAMYEAGEHVPYFLDMQL